MSQQTLLSPDHLITIASVVGGYASIYIEKNPCRTSPLSGKEYIQELLTSHPRRISEVLRMPLDTFLSLCTWLKSRDLLKASTNVTIEEQIAIFMYIVGQNASNRSAQERFQHSGETISRCLNF
jgi:hypothetical protein